MDSPLRVTAAAVVTGARRVKIVTFGLLAATCIPDFGGCNFQK
jgi:hypothetical protein